MFPDQRISQNNVIVMHPVHKQMIRIVNINYGAVTGHKIDWPKLGVLSVVTFHLFLVFFRPLNSNICTYMRQQMSRITKSNYCVR